MATYTYLAADLRTNAILAELPLVQVEFESKLNDSGSFRGRLPLDDPKIQAIGPFSATQPERTALYVDRNGTLVWGGIIWARNWDSQTGQWDLTGQDFLSYFARRRIATKLTYSNIDQLAIVQAVVNWAQGVNGGNIGVTVGTETSGVTRNATYYGWELRKVLDEIKVLGKLDNGFDFAIDVAYDSNGNPAKYLHLLYPRRGTPAVSTGLMFEYPGSVISYKYPDDGSKSANTVYAIGSGNAEAMLISSSSASGQIDAGYPLLEDAITDKTIADVGVLGALARSSAASLAQVVVVPDVIVRADADPVLGSYTTGDEARFRFTDQRFPAPSTGGAGLDTYYRIVGIKVRPPDAGSPEQVTLTLGQTL